MTTQEQQPDRISGVFLYWRESKAQESLADWQERIVFLQGLGMDTLITQFSVVEGTAYYPSEIYPQAAEAGTDPTGLLLDAADAAGFQVHLGVASDEKNWWGIPFRPQDLPAYAVEESERNNAISRELIERYGGRPSLAGIYLSHEIHLGDEWAGDNMPHLVDLFNRMTAGVKQLAPDLPVSTAPFFSLRNTIELYEERWRTFLSQTNIDILMLQDGIGCERDITVDNMVPYYAAIARACADTGVELWSDLELFDLKPPKTVAPERVAAQLEREAPHVAKIVAYSIENLTPGFVESLPGVRRA